MNEPGAWRTRYLDLLADGERRGLRFQALGHYIGQRMTNQELRQMLKDWHESADTLFDADA